MFGLFEPLLPVGSEAPEFTLPESGSGRRVSLREMRGRFVVLVWYPGDDTTICTKQLCEMRDRWEEYQQLGAEVFGVNPQSGESHEKFKAKFQFPFPLLVDKGQTVGKLYATYSLIVRRTVYVISPEGKIVFAERGRPSSETILQAIGEERRRKG